MLNLLEVHGCYLSDSNEDEIIERIFARDDVGYLSLRTCLCGRRIDGFDEYHHHLATVFGAISESADSG